MHADTMILMPAHNESRHIAGLVDAVRLVVPGAFIVVVDDASTDHTAAIAAASARLGGNGRILVRPSGTEPLIRVMGEGDDADLVAEVVGDIAEAISRVSA